MMMMRRRRMIKMMIMMMMVIMGLKVWIMDRLRTDIEKKLHVCSARGDVNGVKDALRKRASIKVAARQAWLPPCPQSFGQDCSQAR